MDYSQWKYVKNQIEKKIQSDPDLKVLSDAEEQIKKLYCKLIPLYQYDEIGKVITGSINIDGIEHSFIRIHYISPFDEKDKKFHFCKGYEVPVKEQLAYYEWIKKFRIDRSDVFSLLSFFYANGIKNELERLEFNDFLLQKVLPFYFAKEDSFEYKLFCNSYFYVLYGLLNIKHLESAGLGKNKFGDLNTLQHLYEKYPYVLKFFDQYNGMELLRELTLEFVEANEQFFSSFISFGYGELFGKLDDSKSMYIEDCCRHNRELNMEEYRNSKEKYCIWRKRPIRY